MSDNTLQQYVSWFRNSSPYINAHKGKTFVLVFGGEVVADELFSAIVHDIALLSTLGVKLVLVHGSRRQVEESLLAAKVQSALANGRRITDAPALALAVQAAGVLRARIEALLSMGIANSPMHNAGIRVCGGNFVTAQPVGVHEGVDFQHTGRLRRVDREGIAAQLALGNIVLISPLGYSPTGEIFNLSKEEVAVSVASALAADKLILLEDALIRDADGQPLRDLPIQLAQSLFEHSPTPVLDAAIQACQLGVERCHVLDYRRDGALLQELFTRDGVGTMTNRGGYENIRMAGIEDVGGIMALIEPLERDGTLVRRSRERLEIDISGFSVVERDGAIIACAALFPDQPNQSAELACVATAPHYRRSGRANRLLEHIEGRARTLGITRLFVLTTRTAHWFLERGFHAAELSELPEKRRELYNYQRNSLVFIKALDS
ncbi:MAG: amino-acid N-acetyltransferase [Gammaproteobacteria bacterium]|nr:amino-acid N-acetyltransferase [Gammaproteobacteria bacterium]